MASTVVCVIVLVTLAVSGYCKTTAPGLLRELDHLMSDLKEIEQITNQDISEKLPVSPSSKRSWKTVGTNNTPQTATKRGKYTDQCAEGFIPCGGVGPPCIRAEYLCDGYRDCYADGWDESPATCGSIKCPENMFKCNSTGQCIKRHDMCNDVIDCDDMEDENIENCGKKRCGHSSTKCPGSNLCVPNKYWCDGSDECPNGEDEKHDICNQVPCDGVRCGDGKCIEADLYCDGFPDCSDGGDEDIEKCGPVRCPPYTKQCGSANYCYREPRFRSCDGHPDCPNGADEEEASCEPVAYEPEQWYREEKRRSNTKLLNMLSRILKTKP